MKLFPTRSILSTAIFAGLLGTPAYADDAKLATIALIKSTITAETRWQQAAQN